MTTCELPPLPPPNLKKSLPEILIEKGINNRITSGIGISQPPNKSDKLWIDAECGPNGQDLIEHECGDPTEEEGADDDGHDEKGSTFTADQDGHAGFLGCGDQVIRR